jgi:branched-chain amino acid transport system ATP-binding protein
VSGAPFLSLQNVNCYYGASHVLQNLSFDLFHGEIVGVLGRNGVGKTTTIQTILGAPPPRTGEIRLDNKILSDLATSTIVKSGVGWVPQGHRIFPALSVAENLDLAQVHARAGPWTLETVYERFPRLRERQRARGDYLSGGEQQMLAIARALLQNPKLLLMDEPSEGLSPLIVQEIGSLILEINSKGTSVLLVEQNLEFALHVAQRILIMNKGTVVYSGTPLELRSSPDIIHSFLGVGVGLLDPANAEGAATAR